MSKNLLNRYVWLVDTIYQAKKITFEEINRRWLRTDMSEGMAIPLRTFHNHRQAIEELFGIDIECSRSGGYYYYIANADDLKSGSVRNWLLSTFAVNNLVNESLQLHGRILFEDNPSGRLNLAGIVAAMRDSAILDIVYQPYWKDKPNQFELAPYCVKVFKQRWYVVGKCNYAPDPRIYALDRITELRRTGKTFVYPTDFDPEALFADCYGVEIGTGEKACAIRLMADDYQRKYLRALPLHHSQKETETTKDYSVFEYWIRPTFDFCQAILSMGDKVEVLAPKRFREQIADVAKRMRKRYK